MPYIYKSFLCQLRLHPYNIRLKKGSLFLVKHSPCNMCDKSRLTWLHLLYHCDYIKSLNLTIPLNFPLIKDYNDLFLQLLVNPFPPFIWYLFKIVKSCIEFIPQSSLLSAKRVILLVRGWCVGPILLNQIISDSHCLLFELHIGINIK